MEKICATTELLQAYLQRTLDFTRQIQSDTSQLFDKLVGVKDVPQLAVMTEEFKNRAATIATMAVNLENAATVGVAQRTQLIELYYTELNLSKRQ